MLQHAVPDKLALGRSKHAMAQSQPGQMPPYLQQPTIVMDQRLTAAKQ